MNRKIIFFLSLLLAANLVEAAVDLTLVPNSRTVVAGTSQQVNFTNTGSSNGRYSMAWVNGREDWMTIVNDNNNTDSGFIVLSPPAGVSGTFTVNIKASQFLSSTESDTETLTVNVTATTQPLTLSVSNFTAQENTVFVIPVGVDGGTPPYTGSITAGSFPGSTQLFYDAVDNRLRFNTTFLSVASTTTYNFTFQITDNAGESVSDNFSVTITNGTTSKPNPPASLSTTAQSPSQIDVSWSSVSGVSDVSTGLYELSRSTFPGSGYQVVYSGTDRNFSDSTGLSEDTLYYYRVRAFTTQFSDYSDPSSARTQEANNNNPRPDLVPENPTASPLQPIPAQYLNGGLDVSNQGLAGASSGSVRFYLDKDSPTFGNQISTQFYSVVGAGQSESVSFQYLIPASLDDGTYFLSYKVDAQNTEINESNENNNTGSLQIQIDSDSTPVDTPPFHVDSVFSPSLPVANQAFSIYAYMDDSNEGDPIEGVEFRYRSNGGSYSQGFPMRYVSNSHNPPLFINEDSFSLPSAGSYNFQYRAVGADWQGSTNLTIQEPLDWDLQFNSLAFNGSGQLTAQVGLTGNVQEIDCDFGIIPASSSGSNNEIAGTFITKKISGGQTVTATFSRTMLSNLPLGVDYRIRGLFEDRNGATQVRLSAPFSPPADQTAITEISTPKVELSPDAIATLGFSVSSAVSQALHLKLSVTQANGNDTAPLVSSLSEFSLLRGNNEIVTDFLVPTGIAIDDYDVVASLWRDANGNRILDSGDQRVTSDRTFENAITLFGGNNPADSNNDSVDDAWQTSNGAIDINADNDGDGRLNWHEYVFGSDPNGRDDSTAQIAIVSDPVLGLNFVDFTYLRRRDLDDGIYTILVETSDDMVTWEDASICFIANRIVDHGNGTETVTFRCTEPTQVNQSLFIRARGLKNTTNGGERFLTRTDILLNALEAQNNGHNNPGTVRYSNPYLRFTTGINLNTLGLETIFDFYRHILSVTSDLSGIEFINNKLAPIPPFGSLVFFGDENLDLHLRVPSVLNLTGDQKEYLDRIRAQGLIGISLGNGLILVPDFTGAIVEIDLASGLDFLGVGVTQQLCLGHVTAEHAQRASNFSTTIEVAPDRLISLQNLGLGNFDVQDCLQAIQAAQANQNSSSMVWAELDLPLPRSFNFIAVSVDGSWQIQPLTNFLEDGEVKRQKVLEFIISAFPNQLFPVGEERFIAIQEISSVRIALCEKDSLFETYLYDLQPASFTAKFADDFCDYSQSNNSDSDNYFLREYTPSNAMDSEDLDIHYSVFPSDSPISKIQFKVYRGDSDTVEYILEGEEDSSGKLKVGENLHIDWTPTLASGSHPGFYRVQMEVYLEGLETPFYQTAINDADTSTQGWQCPQEGLAVHDLVWKHRPIVHIHEMEIGAPSSVTEFFVESGGRAKEWRGESEPFLHPVSPNLPASNNSFLDLFDDGEATRRHIGSMNQADNYTLDQVETLETDPGEETLLHSTNTQSAANFAFLQYWMFQNFSGRFFWDEEDEPIVEHEGDVEHCHIAVKLTNPNDHQLKLDWLEPFSATASQHFYAQTLRWVQNDGSPPPNAHSQNHVEHIGDRLVIYVALGAHATYFAEDPDIATFAEELGTQIQYLNATSIIDITAPSKQISYSLSHLDDSLLGTFQGRWGYLDKDDGGSTQNGPAGPPGRSAKSQTGDVNLRANPKTLHNLSRKSNQTAELFIP